MVESGSDPLPICQPTAFITVVFNIYLKPGSPIILYYPRSSVSNKMIVYPLRCTTGLHARTYLHTRKVTKPLSIHFLQMLLSFGFPYLSFDLKMVVKKQFSNFQNEKIRSYHVRRRGVIRHVTSLS